uniref:GIY-YIG domain-containing protein n=1 Tax=Halochlorococcum sp. NIES-1838 TaxID=2249730 RepID=A0A2Z4MAU0_9CHLO|nr:hypothetical protein [Halochlorococcum sp. NIES-1838]
MTSIDLFSFAKAGVYWIRCLKNNKVYIGETTSLLERSARHFTLLKNKYHESLELQKDFCLYGSDFFLFEIIYFENDLKKRRQLEQKLINQQLPNNCYNLTNSFQINKPQLAQQISIDGRIYDSIKQAEKLTNISKSTIIRRLNNKDDLTYIRLKKQSIKRGKYNFVINGVYYESTHEVVNKNFAKNDNQVRERCRSKNLKWKNWQMIQKNRSNDYPDRE